MEISTLAAPHAVRAVPEERADTVSWTVYAATLAATSIVVGLIWDISWHRSVGRDTLFTSAHLAIYLGAVLSGIVGGYYAFRTSFWGTEAEKARGVRFWGFRAPLGAWVGIWGCIAMLTSAPFDDWWHNAYGLDVKIISPPHSLLALGMFCVMMGALLLVLSYQNRTEGAEQRRLAFVFAFIAGLMLAFAATFISSYAGVANGMRASIMYQATGIALPFVLIGAARASTLRWPATTIAAVSMLVVAAMAWILPLFEATPKLAPIYNPITHMVPPAFPMLLVVPALGIDLVMQRTKIGNDWLLALALGVVFVGLMLAVHWVWGEFMLSPAARNAFFVGDQWAYQSRLGDWRHDFWVWPADGVPGDDGELRFVPAKFALGIGVAMLLAVLSARVGLWWGNGMRRVRR